MNDIETTDDAFVSAMTPNVLADKELHPFSLMRQNTVMLLGGGSADLEGKTMSQAERIVARREEAMLVVWVCTLPPSEVMRARRDKEASITKAYEWAECFGEESIFAIWHKIRSEINKSADAQPAGDKTADPNSGGAPAS